MAGGQLDAGPEVGNCSHGEQGSGIIIYKHTKLVTKVIYIHTRECASVKCFSIHG